MRIEVKSIFLLLCVCHIVNRLCHIMSYCEPGFEAMPPVEVEFLYHIADIFCGGKYSLFH